MAEFFGLATSLIQIIGSINQISFSTTERRLRDAYGKKAAVLIKYGLRDTFETLEYIDERVLRGSDDFVLAFKNSYVFDCSMTVVAGSIIAQVAITALSLPYLSQTHWVSRGFFIASLVSGCFSVYSAVVLQRTIGRLYEAEDIRIWISGPRRGESMPLKKPRKVDITEMTSTLLAAQMLSTPSSMINIALSSFLTGLAVYLGFIWTRKLDTSSGLNDSRDVFITFITSALLFFSFYTIPIGVKGVWKSFQGTPTGPQNPRGDSNSIVLNHIEDVSLISALQAAASAHEESAKADRLVAAEYARRLASADFRLNSEITEA